MRLCHAHSSTDGLEVTAIYTGKYLELNALRLGLKNISISNKLDNGQEEKIIFVPLFGMACNLLPLRRSFSVLQRVFGLNFCFFQSAKIVNEHRSYQKRILLSIDSFSAERMFHRKFVFHCFTCEAIQAVLL